MSQKRRRLHDKDEQQRAKTLIANYPISGPCNFSPWPFPVSGFCLTSDCSNMVCSVEEKHIPPYDRPPAFMTSFGTGCKECYCMEKSPLKFAALYAADVFCIDCFERHTASFGSISIGKHTLEIWKTAKYCNHHFMNELDIRVATLCENSNNSEVVVKENNLYVTRESNISFFIESPIIYISVPEREIRLGDLKPPVFRAEFKIADKPVRAKVDKGTGGISALKFMYRTRAIDEDEGNCDVNFEPPECFNCSDFRWREDLGRLEFENDRPPKTNRQRQNL